MAIRKHAAALSAGALLVLYGAQASGQATTTTVGAPVTLYAPSGTPIGQDSGHPVYVTGGTGGTGGSSNSVNTGSTSAAATPVQDAASGAPLELNSTGQSILTKLVWCSLDTCDPSAYGHRHGRDDHDREHLSGGTGCERQSAQLHDHQQSHQHGPAVAVLRIRRRDGRGGRAPGTGCHGHLPVGRPSPDFRTNR